MTVLFGIYGRSCQQTLAVEHEQEALPPDVQWSNLPPRIHAQQQSFYETCLVSLDSDVLSPGSPC